VTTFSIYFDASGHPDGLDVLSLAGFIADVDQWIGFERNWREILDRPDFRVSSLHMKTFCHSIGEFSGWRNDEPRRRKFLSALIAVIKTRVRHSFASSIYLPAYRELDRKYMLSERIVPLAYCGASAVGNVRLWARRWGIPQSDISYFFEDGDKDRHKLEDELRRTYGISPVFLKKSQSVAFQAADLLAYEQFRANQNVVPQPGTFSLEEMRHPLQDLVTIPNGDDSSDWGITERPELEEFCREQKIPLRGAAS
jgi:hypothetical protein